MRRDLVLSTAILSLVLLAAAALLLKDTGQADVMDALPADSALVLHLSNPAALEEALDPEAPEAGSPVRPAESAHVATGWIDALRAREPGVELSEAALGDLLRREAALAFFPGPSGQEPSLAIVARQGRRAGSGTPAGRRLAAALAPGHEPAWIEKTRRGRTWLLLRSGEGRELCVASASGLALATSSSRGMKRLLDTLDRRERRLSRDPAYRAAREALPSRAALYVHLSGQELRVRIHKAFSDRPGLDRALSLAGIDAVRHAALALRARDGLFDERLFFVLAPRRRGLLAPLLSGPPRAEPKKLPADPRFALQAVWSHGDAARDALAALLEDDASAGALGTRLSAVEDFLDLDFARDVLGSIGRDVLVWIGDATPYPRSADGSPAGLRWATSFSLSRPETFRRILGRMDGLARIFSLRRTQSDAGGEITWFDIPAISPITPSYQVDGRVVRLASSPDLLRAWGSAGPRSGPTPHGLPDRAHLYFRVSTGRLFDLARGQGMIAPDAEPAGYEPVPGRASGADFATGSARLEASGLILQWVSPASASGFALRWLLAPTADPIPSLRDPDPTLIEDPLY